MKKLTLTFLSILLATGFIRGQLFNSKNDLAKGAMDVHFSKNIEFLGFTFFLGSMGSRINPEEEIFNGQVKLKDWYAHDLALYQKYKSFQGSENLNKATEFIERTDGADLSLLFLQLEDFPNAKAHNEITDDLWSRYSASGDTEEGKRNAVNFMEALNRFYREVDFDQYFRENKNKYEHALRQIKEGLPDDSFIPAMEAFYNSRFDQYTLIPSLTIPTGMGFGTKQEQKDKTIIYNVFGPLGAQFFSNDSSIDMGFGDNRRLRELSTHEFGHSFVNRAIEQLPEETIEAGRSLFAPIKSAMEDQSYLSWEVCLGEHFVRAGEILIAQNLGKKEDAENLRKDYIENRKFIYLPVILGELEKYNKSKQISYQEAVIRAMDRLNELAKK